MKILILGIDGYIGWPLALHLKDLGHEVSGVDALLRRHRVSQLGSESLIPIDGIFKKQQSFDIVQQKIHYMEELGSDWDVIVHLAEQPSAPWSMKGMDPSWKTQRDNVLGTLRLLWLMRDNCPDAHLVKLGSMGEYGTPPVDVIPEGFIEEGPLKGLSFPKQPGSFYHLSKVFDSMNIEFACRTWNIRCTDIMQGVVFGHLPGTRFDYDECFGTVINRFCVQAVAGIPLTVYGSGNQVRGFLPLKDSIECLTLVIDNPPDKAEYRVFNQFAETYSINFIANTVQEVVTMESAMNPMVIIDHIPNPRKEAEEHRYNPKHDNLKRLGYKPDWNFQEEIRQLIEAIKPFKDRIREEVIQPRINWR